MEKMKSWPANVYHNLNCDLTKLDFPPGCASKIVYTLQMCKNQTCQKQHEKYQLQVKITYNHNHKVLSNTNFDFCRVSDKTEDEIISIFKSGKGPAKAMRLYRKNLKTEIGNLGYLKIAANRSINPDRNFYF